MTRLALVQLPFARGRYSKQPQMSRSRHSSSVSPTGFIDRAMFSSLMRHSGACLRSMSSAFHQISSGVFFAIFSWNFGVGRAVFSTTSRMMSESGL